MSDDEHIFKVDLLTRVEGEGRFYLKVRDGVVVDARLNIFEAPRYFEALLRGRRIDEVPDIVARICGICPVAYQMSAVKALEHGLGLVPEPAIRALRRLLYCGEWVESHALHIYLLHAPDFLGYPSALEMAKDHKSVVERGLQIKKVGNALIAELGGRAIHPVSVRVGGFSAVPARHQLKALLPDLQAALEAAMDTVRWTSTFQFDAFTQDYRYACLDSEAYPMEWGEQIYLSTLGVVPVEAYAQHIREEQVPHSTALQSRLVTAGAVGETYLTGPLARLNRHADKLHPIARQALLDSGLQLPVTNPYQSIIVRAIEVVHALAEAIDIIQQYQPPSVACQTMPSTQDQAIGIGATEAPRGLLYHRYAMAGGAIEAATIIPPTSQNQAQIEADLVAIAPQLLKQSQQEATHLCEKLIRAYDPCISCATHFLKLEMDIEEKAGVETRSPERPV